MIFLHKQEMSCASRTAHFRKEKKLNYFEGVLRNVWCCEA